jgi:hypothetical protein
MHSSKLFNFVDKNYIITHIEALVMTYALHKFRHYLLGNMFTFYVDHMVSMYLFNKLQNFGRLVKWLLLFLEYDFKIIYKPDRSHLMVDALNRLHNQIEHVGIPNQTCDAHLFTFQPKWL